MGDFTDILAAVPEFTAPALRESFVNTQGLEIVRITPMNGAKVLYLSSVQVNSTQGQMNIQFPIPADSIEDAVRAWQECARTALKATAEKMRENQRRIVLPGNPAANTQPPFKMRTVN